jgi:DNA-binding CsgD family transcriptional regulator
VATEEIAVETLSPDTVVPDALPLATLSVTDEQLSARAGVRWTATEEELGAATVSVVRVNGDGPAFVLLSYEAAHGVTVLGSPAATDADLDRLFAALGVRDEEVQDRLEDAVVPPERDVERLMAEVAKVREEVDALAGDVSALQRSHLDTASGRHAPSRLTRGQQDVLALSFTGHSYGEIAAMLGLSERAVRQRLARARRVLATD